MQEVKKPDRIAIRGLDPELWRRFRAEAVMRGAPAGRLLNDLLREWLDRETK